MPTFRSSVICNADIGLSGSSVETAGSSDPEEGRLMKLFGKIRAYAVRRALERRIHAELATITNAELGDLKLNRAKRVEISRRQARLA
jgi:uncharacterized protein YjiS (DUF1127 family)